MRPELRRRGRNRWYVDLDAPMPGQDLDTLDLKKVKYQKIPGVTSIIRDGLPKAALINYAGSATADYAVNNWEMLGELPPADRLKRLNAGRYEDRDAAAQRGQQVHNIAHDLVGGADVPVPPELRGYVDAAVRFMNEFDVIEFCAELTVFNETHYYCGTIDLGASVPIPDLTDYDWIPRGDAGRARGLFDYKTAPSGIWGDLSFQLAPYWFAEWAVTRDGEVIEMPEFDFAAGVHLRRDGTYSVVPVECGESEFKDFLTIKANAGVVEGARYLTMPEIVPPRKQLHRLVKVEDPQ